jgi:hypothetical protein
MRKRSLAQFTAAGAENAEVSQRKEEKKRVSFSLSYSLCASAVKRSLARWNFGRRRPASVLKSVFYDFKELRRPREMESVQEIYDSAIRHLPSDAQILLASLILEKVVGAQCWPTTKAGRRRSVRDILKDWPGQRLFETSAEADAYLREERDSWDH